MIERMIALITIIVCARAPIPALTGVSPDVQTGKGMRMSVLTTCNSACRDGLARCDGHKHEEGGGLGHPVPGAESGTEWGGGGLPIGAPGGEG